MTDSVASTSAPPWARLMWYGEDGRIYMEMPVVGSHPITLPFDPTDAGLDKALKMMRKVAREDVQFVPWNGRKKSLLDHPIVKRSRQKVNVTNEVRATAAKLLRKVGIIK